MDVIKTAIDGVVIIEPRVFKDARGYFFESFSQREFEEKVHKINFVQDNESMSSYGVMRGLHFQRPPFTQSKLVRCVKGAVLDVAVDIRKGSPTYGQHVAVELSEENHRQFFVPRGFAHGFAVLSETAVFQYKCDNFYAPEADERAGPAQQLPDVHRAERLLLLGAVADYAHRGVEGSPCGRTAALAGGHRRDGRALLAGHVRLQPSGGVLLPRHPGRHKHGDGQHGNAFPAGGRDDGPSAHPARPLRVQRHPHDAPPRLHHHHGGQHGRQEHLPAHHRN